jgi:hypothetical protein
MKIEKLRIGDKNLYYYNYEWQIPVITELRSFELFRHHQNIPDNYLAFPWATMIDNYVCRNEPKLFYKISAYKIKDKSCFTIIQHISFRNYLELFKKIGVTHVFTPHKTISDIELEKKYGIKIIAYSLYPTQHNDTNMTGINERKYLTSFIGQYNKWYLTDIRERIFNIFNKYAECYIIRRTEWHYESVVYRNTTSADITTEEEYQNALRESKFSLCPSGTGPNSIRIWESMSFGSIPIILADTLVLPELKDVNWNDYFIIWKEKDIDTLYDYIKTIKPEKIDEMCQKNIELYNKYFSKDMMINIILEYYEVNLI